MKIPIPPEIKPTLLALCQEHLMMPTDLFLIWSGQRSRQPFVIDSTLIRGRKQKTRFMTILYALWKASPTKFEEAVVSYRGHKRKLFGRTREEVEATGRSNVAERLSDSGWYVAVGMSAYSKMNRIEEVMRRMGFTQDYAYALGWFPSRGELSVEI